MILELALLASIQQQTGPAAGNSYLFFVASEALDQVALVRFGPRGAIVEHRTPVRLPSVDSTGPRGLRMSPNGLDYYVTTARGFPNGELVQVRIGADSSRYGQPLDTLRAREPLGDAPGALALAPDGQYAWVTNSSALSHADPSWVSVVYLPEMVEVDRIVTCLAPRGGRLTADGAKHYSVCAGSDELVEIGAQVMQVTRRLALPPVGTSRCAPGGVAIAPGAAHLYVTCAESNDVIEVDVATWAVARRFKAGGAPGDIAITADGQTLVVVNASSRTISIIEIASGRELAAIPARLHVPSSFGFNPADPYLVVGLMSEIARLAADRVPRDVALSSDNRYAFVSVAGKSSDPGTVDIIDLTTRRLVATVEVGPGARGIDFWKMQAPK